MKYKKNKTIRNIILAAVITIVVLALVVGLNDFENTWDVLQHADGVYISYSVALILIYFLLYPIPLCIFTKSINKKVKFWRVYIIGTTEHFFNDITPFATGGQPFQAYAMKKAGVKVRESTGILLMNYIVFMLVTNTFAIASLAYYKQYTENISNLDWVVIIGFSINFLVLVMFFVMAFSKTFRNLATKLMIKITRRRKLKEKAEKEAVQIEEYFSQAQDAVQKLMKSPLLFISTYFLKALTMAIYYAVPFFIIMALVSYYDPSYLASSPQYIWYIMAGTAFASTIVVWVPTPGASGGIELAFKQIFSTVPGVSSAIAMSSMLIWRLLTFYGVAALSCIGYFTSERISARLDTEYNLKEIPEIMESDPLVDKTTAESISKEIKDGE